MNTILRHLIGVLATFVLLAVSVNPAASDPTVTFNPKSGLFSISYKSAEVVTAHLTFWRDKWRWINVAVDTEGQSPEYTSRGKARDGELRISGAADLSDPRNPRWQTNISISKQYETRVFGGLAFQFNIEPFKTAEFEPQLEVLPDENGWTLQLEPDQEPIVFRFSSKPARLSFLRGQKRELRASFFEHKEKKSAADFAMALEMPDGASVRKPESERYAAFDSNTWFNGLLQWNVFPVDLSYLNSEDLPAGRRGFVQVVGDGFQFEDGTEARFWGTNLTPYALFTTSRTVKCKPAERLSQLGFNLVRIHHHDSNWVKPNIFGKEKDNTRSIDPNSLDKIDWWIHCLKKNGIYVWLDLNVGRTFTEGDGIDHFDETAKTRLGATVRGFGYINESIQNRMQEFAAEYVSHVNPYTGIAYKDEPAIIGMLITNENDLTHHFGNALLPDKGVPAHSEIYMRLAAEFARKWNLPEREVWKSWEPGVSKLFLSDLENRFNIKMIRHLRDIGVRVPLSTTNTWGKMPLSSLFPLTDGDVIDVHSYGTNTGISTNPRYVDNLVNWMAAGQVEGMPLTVTEWDPQPFPVAGRSVVPPYVAAISALQGWDAMMQYAYSQNDLSRDLGARNWQAFNDPAILSLMPAAALLFRSGHVQAAKKTYALTFGDRTYIETISPLTSPAIRTLTEQSKVVVRLPKPQSLPWLKEHQGIDDAIVVRDPKRSFLPAGATRVTSDTGELSRDWKEGVFRIDTSQTQMIGGWIGGRTRALSDTTVETEMPYAVIAVQSMTEQPISKSNRILVSTGAQAHAHKKGYSAEPIDVEISINAKPGLSLFALLSNGNRKEIPVTYSDGTYQVNTTPKHRTWWYVLEGAE